MLVIGLTGGIASGKSTATDFFRTLGVPVIDADEISHELVEPGQPTLSEIIRTFGKEYITPDGQLDRGRLRRLVFSNPEQRLALEHILHPRIRREIQQRLAGLDAPYCIVCIPLLVETNQADLVDRILVIDASTETQISRLQQRQTMNDDEIQGVLTSQASRHARLEVADDTILNDGSIASLHKKLGALHREYLALAAVSSR